MPNFQCKARELTPRTIVHDVVMDKKVICSCGSSSAAQRIAEVFAEKQITTLKAYKALSACIRLSFVDATMQTEPNFN